MADPDLHHILIYSYVADMATLREPHRSAHLARIIAQRDTGHIYLAGGFDPPTGGAIVFRGVDREHVEAFVASDPYYINGLVTGYRIERWNLLRGH
jgi:uncharacterized protein YciI